MQPVTRQVTGRLSSGVGDLRVEVKKKGEKGDVCHNQHVGVHLSDQQCLDEHAW